MASKTKSKPYNKFLASRVPHDRADIAMIVEMAAEALGLSVSEWLWGVILHKLQAAGLLNLDNSVRERQVDELVDALPPGSIRRALWRKRARPN